MICWVRRATRHRLLGRQRQRLVVGVGVQRLGAAEHRRHRLQRGADDVVERLLGGQRDAGGLGVEAQPHRLLALGAVGVSKDATVEEEEPFARVQQDRARQAGKADHSMPALPVVRPRRRTRARSLNTVTSAMRASTITALSAVRGDITTPGTFSPRVCRRRRYRPRRDHGCRGGDQRERTAARAQFAGIRASVIVRRPG